MGLPVTVLMDNAAPPRASPSNLVSTNPVNASRRSNSAAVRTASCPIIASQTNRMLAGCVFSLIWSSSVISVSSSASRPAVSKITTSRPTLRACVTASEQSCTGVMPLIENTGTFSLRPSVVSWSTAAGR